MSGSRTERREKERERRRRFVVPAAVVAILVLAAAGLTFAGLRMLRSSSQQPVVASQPMAPVVDARPAVSTAAVPRLPVEVPDVRGKTLEAASIVMGYAGFVVTSQGATGSADATGLVVVTQVPMPGTRLLRGEGVTLNVAPAGSPKTRRYIVVLDPGHQSKADTGLEPVGPGSKTMKQKVTAGAVGVATRQTEPSVSLTVAKRIAARLTREGIIVRMTRTSDDVHISNADRARMATTWGADLFVRIHADALTDPRSRGVSVMYPSGNAWVQPVSASSQRAARLVCAGAASAAHAPSRGLAPAADIAGFNWARCPSILVEAGCLSNETDDRLLTTAAYQDGIADGVTRGILGYFGR